MEITLGIVLFVLFASLVAAVIRMRDVPITVLAIKPFLIALGSSLIAAILAVWMFVAVDGAVYNFDTVITLANFLVVAGAAVGGMSFVQALIAVFTPAKTE